MSITGFLTYKLYETMRYNEMLELEKMTVSMSGAKESDESKQEAKLEKLAKGESK